VTAEWAGSLLQAEERGKRGEKKKEMKKGHCDTKKNEKRTRACVIELQEKTKAKVKVKEKEK
jgi:hypothetical protein